MTVAGYCRVSTDRDDQANSFEAQQRYFREYIQQHPDWTLHEIYADEGITGTSTRKRTQFNRMIRDAHDGKFTLILTKEVSRFSRNILDTIAYTRELRAIGVGVLFVTDRIHTMEPESEMLLSFLASLAQEESRRTSSRVVWGQTRQMEQGVVFGRSLLGYDVRNGKLTVNPEGAELVRLIFHKYALEQMSARAIAAYLTEQGFKTHRGNPEWSSGTVIKILNNEKYVGDLVQKKTYTPDFLTHEKRQNRGEVPQIRISHHHEAIISRELWDLAQDRLQSSHGQPRSGGHSGRYGFSGKIRCASCGAVFVRRQKLRKSGAVIRSWNCATAVSGGVTACAIGKTVRDEDAMQMLKTAMGNLPMDTEALVRDVAALALDAILYEERNSQDDPRQLQSRIDSIIRKKEAMMDSYFSGDITKSEMVSMKARYAEQIAGLQTRIARTQFQPRAPEPPGSRLTSAVRDILTGRTESAVFCKTMVERLTVYPDRHMELKLNRLELIFTYMG